MAIFQKKTATTKKPVAKKEPKTETVGTPTVLKSFVLKSPRVSEKAAMLAAKGVYVFNVPITANKISIRKSVESKYQVKVVGVRTVRGEGKFVRRGKTQGQRNAWKKAMVTLAKGTTINLYAGV